MSPHSLTLRRGLGLRLASRPAWLSFLVFPGTGGVSTADSGLGADPAPAPLDPAQRSPPVSEAPHQSPTPARVEGAGAWPSAPPVLASWKSGWHHAQLISRSSLARYLLGGSLGKWTQLSRLLPGPIHPLRCGNRGLLP